MRILILIAFTVYCYFKSTAQHTRQETLQWLQKNLTLSPFVSNLHGSPRNTTAMCISCSEHPKDSITDADFHDNIRSFITWNNGTVTITNYISRQQETEDVYEYSFHATAITNSHLTNRVTNMQGQVNVYKDRPLFITIKPNTAIIKHTTHSKEKPSTTITYRNTKQADWDSIIPVFYSFDKWKYAQEVLDTLQHLVSSNKEP